MSKKKNSKKSNKAAAERKLFKGNGHAILVLGKATSGKTSCLMNLNNPAKSTYLNSDIKPLPFKDKFGVSEYITEPHQVLDYLKLVNAGKLKAPVNMILDTITHTMSMFNTQIIENASNTQQAWGDYATFYRLVTHEIKVGRFNTIVLGHLTEERGDDGSIIESKCPVQGQIGKIGVESDYSTVFESIVMPVKKLKKFKNKLLNITKAEQEDGVKRVFLTRRHKKFPHTKARSQHDLFSRDELFIDNDIQAVLNRLDEYNK